MKFIITEEQSEKLNHKIKSIVKKYGIEHTLNLFDNDIIRNAYIDNPSEYLNQFNDLKPVEIDNEIYYLDKNRLPLIYYIQDKINGYVYIDYDIIWLFFSVVIGLKRSEILNILKNWLEETYNITGLTPNEG